MYDSEYSEHKSKNSFHENEDNETENLDEPFKGMGLNPTIMSLLKKLRKNTGSEQSDSFWKDVSG